MKNENLKKKIGQMIKERRELLGYSQAQLGFKALGYDKSKYNSAQQKIRKIESSKQDINVDELKKIATILNLPLNDILDISPQQTNPQSNDLALTVLAGRVEDLSQRINAQGAILQTMGVDSLKTQNDIKEILKLMTNAAESRDVRKLKKVG